MGLPRLYRVLGLVAVVGGAALVVPALADASAPKAAGKGGPIVGIGGRCADVDHSRTADGTRIQLWGCNSTGAQKWSAGAHQSLRALGKCMTVAASSAAVELRTCTGAGGQVWNAQADGTLLNPASKKCLRAPRPASGTRIVVAACKATADRRWRLPADAPGQAGDEVARKVLDQLNAARKDNGLPAYTMNAGLVESARLHTQRMID